MKPCYSCGEDLSHILNPSRQDTCPRCNAYVRSCKNCRFYDRYAHNSCREFRAEWVEDKERANFCEYFEFAGSAAGGKKQAAREGLKNLFKKREE